MELADQEPVSDPAFLQGFFLVNVVKPEILKTFKDYEYYVFAVVINNCKELGESALYSKEIRRNF